MENKEMWRVAHLVVAELERAVKIHAPMTGPHHGYAVILEELDELWTLVKGHHDSLDRGKMRAECIQIAAMAIRFYMEASYR